MRPAGGIGIRACLRSTIFRVRIRGGVPDFLRERRALACSFTTWMWQSGPRRALGPGLRLRAARRGQHGSRRLMVRTAVFQAANAGSIPAGNANSSRCSAAGQRAWSGTTRPQVRILPARPIDSPVAQWKQERAATNREGEGSNPSWGANHGAVAQPAERPLVEREAAGSSPAGAAITVRSSTAQSSRLLTGRLQVRLLPHRPMLG